MRAYRRIETLPRSRRGSRPGSSASPRSVSLEVRKARRVRARVLSSSDEKLEATSAGSHAITPESELLGREAAEIIARALERPLRTKRRALLLLRLDHGLAYEEIAAAMGFSLAKVKVEIHRARQILREELDRYQGDRS